MPNGSANNNGCGQGTKCCPACDAAHPCGAGRVCCNGVCKSGDCCIAAHCTDPAKPVCRANVCSPCATNAQCGSGKVCCDGSCFAGTCCGDAGCPTGERCVSHVCSCDASGQSCASGTTCCGATCVNSQTDAANCGACGTICSFPNAAATCAAGQCQLGTCDAGFANCDVTAVNGCETNVQTDVNHCGNCATTCSFPNATATCVGGQCRMGTCAAGFADCDGVAANGCEVNVQTNLGHCGACGRLCTATTCRTATCAGGVCGSTPITGAQSLDCSGADRLCCSGSCRNIATDAFNCGSCGNFCLKRGAACETGACVCPATTHECLTECKTLCSSRPDFWQARFQDCYANDPFRQGNCAACMSWAGCYGPLDTGVAACGTRTGGCA